MFPARLFFKLSHHFRDSLVNFQLPILAWEKFLCIEPRVYAVFFQAGVESGRGVTVGVGMVIVISWVNRNYSAMSLRAVFWRSNLPFIRPD
jgi:hypothetical protein